MIFAHVEVEKNSKNAMENSSALGPTRPKPRLLRLGETTFPPLRRSRFARDGAPFTFARLGDPRDPSLAHQEASLYSGSMSLGGLL